MNLSPWTDTPFGDDDAFLDFLMVHGLSHERIASVIFASNVFYTTYPLMESPQNNKDWLLTHYQEHQSIFSVLGMTGLPDLATVNMENEDEFNDWMLQHQQIHTRINAAIGIV